MLTLAAVFTPEHGLFGADPKQKCFITEKGIPIYNLYYGQSKRIPKEVLEKLDVLVYDIQDIGCRSYTYVSTLFYAMEEAAKCAVPIVVLDRPNPLGGMLVDGPMLSEGFRSDVGYANVPYCHGMTAGELALFFRGEYKIACQLTVIPLRGWARDMHFEDTKLSWVPTSPNIPEATTAFFYPTTGLIGELNFVCIGVGTPLPFRVIVAPWINGGELVARLQRPGPEGVCFQEIHFTPTAGQFRDKECQGALIIIKDPSKFNPMKVGFSVFDVLRQLYPQRMKDALAALPANSIFYKVCGSKRMAEVLLREKAPFSSLVTLDEQERQVFLGVRKKYLIPSYAK